MLAQGWGAAPMDLYPWMVTAMAWQKQGRKEPAAPSSYSVTSQCHFVARSNQNPAAGWQGAELLRCQGLSLCLSALRAPSEKEIILDWGTV